ncbi:MAG: acetyl-CoA carboxylase carboxyl transferase subunit alpha, partial [Gemmatimonadota bacterium]
DMAADAAEALKLTAPDLADSGIIDEVLPEPPGGAHQDPEAAAEVLREAIRRHLTDLDKLSAEQLVETRRAKYYAMGAWEEPGADG